jgi:hypothetical protein
MGALIGRERGTVGFLPGSLPGCARHAAPRPVRNPRTGRCLPRLRPASAAGPRPAAAPVLGRPGQSSPRTWLKCEYSSWAALERSSSLWRVAISLSARGSRALTSLGTSAAGTLAGAACRAAAAAARVSVDCGVLGAGDAAGTGSRAAAAAAAAAGDGGGPKLRARERARRLHMHQNCCMAAAMVTETTLPSRMVGAAGESLSWAPSTRTRGFRSLATGAAASGAAAGAVAASASRYSETTRTRRARAAAGRNTRGAAAVAAGRRWPATALIVRL